ncbi:MAG: CBS domain-containing protein [Rhodospirillales bacterium]|nr:CBS domain-containing protein [Rhodospirillales bacterium]
MEKLDCQSIMRHTTTSLYEDAQLSSAIEFMTENRMGLIPIVNREETFVGQLSGDQLMRSMMPKTLGVIRPKRQAEDGRQAWEDIRQRLDKMGDLPIRKVMDRHAKVVRPDTPLIEALSILSQNQNVVPVVEQRNGRLVGAISFFTVLDALREAE